MERYEAYKDSGVEWIGEIPSHWDVHPLGAHSTMIVPMRDKPTRFDGDIPWIRIEDFDGKYIATSKSEQNVSDGLITEMNLKVYPIGTVLCSCSCNLGVCAIVKRPLCSNQTFIGCVPAEHELDSDFLFYLMISMDRRLNYLSSGTIQTYLSRHDFEHLAVQIPPIHEQGIIANYLDARTTEIDALVADCEREVGLLREYRKAVISEAVTKGLDPDAPLKDSGVEWIGEIPEGWLVHPSKTLFAEGKELRHPNDEQCAASQKYGIIPQAQYIALENQRMVAADKNLDAWKHVEPGDFVISLRSFQGGLELSSISGCVTWHYIVLKGSCLVESTYYKYLFKTQKYIESLQRTCTYIRDGQDLRYSNFVQVPLPLPPRKEQFAIGAYLDSKTAEIDSLIDAKQSMADKLREYRKSLISEAVTGKFKVPGV